MPHLHDWQPRDPKAAVLTANLFLTPIGSVGLLLKALAHCKNFRELGPFATLIGSILLISALGMTNARLALNDQGADEGSRLQLSNAQHAALDLGNALFAPVGLGIAEFAAVSAGILPMSGPLLFFGTMSYILLAGKESMKRVQAENEQSSARVMQISPALLTTTMIVMAMGSMAMQVTGPAISDIVNAALPACRR